MVNVTWFDYSVYINLINMGIWFVNHVDILEIFDMQTGFDVFFDDIGRLTCIEPGNRIMHHFDLIIGDYAIKRMC